MVEDGIVAPYRIGAQISFGLFHRQRIGQKVLALLLEDISGNEPCHRMRLGVCRAAQPADGLLIEQLYVLIDTPTEKVVFHIPYCILYLALGLRVSGHGEHRLKARLCYKLGHLVCRLVVAIVFVRQQFTVLVIEYLPGHATEVFEGQVMGIDCRLCGEGNVLQIDELVTRAAQHHDEGMHLDTVAA